MREPRDCVICGVSYIPRPGRPNQKYCSLQCAGKGKIVEPSGPPFFTCAYCGLTKERRRFRMKDGTVLGYDKKTRFCSIECGYKGRKLRPINPNGHLTQGTGYIRVNLRGGGHILKHRQVMEGMLGRALLPGESAHHRNGQRTDNREANLELWSTRQPPGQRVVDKIAFAVEMIELYPEFAQAIGKALVDCAPVPLPLLNNGALLEHSPFNTPP